MIERERERGRGKEAARSTRLFKARQFEAVLCLHDDGLGVSPERRDPNGGAGDLHVVVQAEDLLQLPGDLAASGTLQEFCRLVLITDNILMPKSISKLVVV